MKSIDERVVEMQFDNKQFERETRATMSTLEDLKKGLNMEGAVKGFSDLDRAGKSVNLSSIAEGVDAIASRFTALGIMATTVLANLTTSALRVGERLVSALTIDPIKTGLDEYETKMGSIQTILTNTASKGTTLEDVTRVLNDLNTYSDKTIYNFAEMARNIGTFTAAGNGLEESATAIKGIANLAAGSGSNAQQASTAMYQLSQALATGTVRLMDWNSVVNAGMGGELFQKALEKTAVELGHGRDMSVSFRDSLEQGWLTSEVLMKTLNKFAEDEALVKAATQVKTFTQLFDTMKESVQSGWAQSWESIIGDKDQATKTLTAINDAFGSIVGASAAARNEMLSFWNANGGRDALINSFTNAFKGLSSVLTPIHEAFREIFPAMTGERLVEITKSVEAFTEKLKIGDQTASYIKTTFKGLFSLLDIGAQVIGTVVKGIGMLFGVTMPAGEGVLYLTSRIGEFISSVDDTIKASGVLTGILEKLKDVLAKIPNSFDGLDKVPEMFYNLAEGIGKAFDYISENISNGLENFSLERMFAIIDGGLFAAILLGVRKFVKSLTDVVDNGSSFLDSITGILDGVKGSLVAYQNQIKAGTIMKIAISVGILAAALVALSTIDPDKLASSLSAMSVMFAELIGSMAVFEKFVAGPGLKSIITLPPMLLALSTSILILSVAMTKLAELDWKGIGKGLTAVGVLCAELVLFMRTVDASGLGVRSGLGVLLLASALLVLAQAVKSFGSIDTGVLIKGLMGVAAVLAEIALFVRVTGDAKGVITTAIGLTILGGAMLIFSKAIESMGSMSLEQIGKGLLAMAGALTAITLALNFMPKGMVVTGVGLIAVATALLILSNALQNMGGMSWDEIGKGLVTLAGALTIITIAMNFMTTALPGAAALLVVAGALAILTPVLKALGTMSWGEIGKGLLTLAGVFVVLGVAGLVLTPLIPSLLGLGAAVVLVGVGCLAAGAGILALSAGLTALSVAGTAGVVALVAIVTGLIGLIPMALQKLGEGVLAFANVIADGGTAITGAFTTIMLSLIDAILVVVPKIVDAGILLLIKLLEGISANIYRITVLAIDIVVKFIEGVASMLPRLTQAGFDLIISFMDSLAVAIENNSERLGKSFVNLGTAMIDGLVQGLLGGVNEAIDTVQGIGSSIIDTFKNVLGIHSPSQVFYDAAGNIIGGLTNGLNDGKPKAVSTAKNLADESLKAVRDTSAAVSVENGKYIVDGIVIGMVSKQPDMYEASKLLAQAVKNGLIEEQPRFTEIGKTEATAFMTGMSEQQIIDLAWASGVKVSSSAWEGAKSTAEQMAAAGTAAGQAYIDGLNEAAKKAAAAAEAIANKAASGGYSKAFKAEADAINSGAAYGLDQLSKLTDAEAKKYYEAGGGAAGKAAVEAGKNTSSGLASGITSGVKAVSNAVKTVTSGAVSTIKKTLGINSPSRVFMEMGEYSVLGFVEGIKTLASSSIADIINDSIGSDPVIRPVLDLDEIQNGMNGIAKMLGSENDLAIQMANAKNSRGETSENVNGTSEGTQTTYSFTQNNYSPKPLSRIELYRQTKNQFSALKGVVNNR